jgi:3-oxoacyl-[acyl-carrier protein] reductase
LPDHIIPARSAPRRILITGASGDIGSAIARHICRPGDHFLVHYSTNLERAKALADELSNRGATADCVHADLVQPIDRESFATGLMAAYGDIDILVNNAGGPIRPISVGSYTDSDISEIMGLNFHSALLLSQAVFSGMCDQGYGRIVNISSIGVKFGGGSDSLVYSAAKSALEILTMNLSKLGAPHNVLVNTIRAGVIRTQYFDKYPKDLEARRQLIPVKRLGQVNDIAAMAAYLVSDAADFISGQTLTVSGGE